MILIYQGHLTNRIAEVKTDRQVKAAVRKDFKSRWHGEPRIHMGEYQGEETVVAATAQIAVHYKLRRE